MKRKTGWRYWCMAFSVMLLFAVCAFPKQVCAASVLDKYKNVKVYDITKYGADKTGKKSINKAAEAVLTAIKTDRKQGILEENRQALIYFPEGTYKSTSLIQLKDKVSVAAEAKTTVKFSGEGGLKIRDATGATVEGGTWISNQKVITILCNRCQNVKICNLKIQSGLMGIKIAGGSAKIENVNVTKCLKIGLSMTRANVTVKKSKFNNNGYKNNIDYLKHGIGVYEGSKLTISDSEMKKNLKFGVSVVNSKLVMKKCKLYENGRHALDAGGVSNISMTNCDIYKNGHIEKQDGIIISHGTKGKFVNCKFRSNAISGILVNLAGTTATFKGCTFSGNEAHNIHAYNTDKGKVGVTVDGCTFGKCKAGESVRFYVSSKNGYSLKIKGKNTYIDVKPKYTFVINGQFSYIN